MLNLFLLELEYESMKKLSWILNKKSNGLNNLKMKGKGKFKNRWSQFQNTWNIYFCLSAEWEKMSNHAMH